MPPAKKPIFHNLPLSEFSKASHPHPSCLAFGAHPVITNLGLPLIYRIYTAPCALAVDYSSEYARKAPASLRST